MAKFKTNSPFCQFLNWRDRRYNKKMTKRERILTTLKHKEPDRIPVDLGGMDSTGITGIAYNKLKKFLRI